MKQHTNPAVLLLIAAACTSGDQRSLTAPDGAPNSVGQTGASISVTSLPSLGGESFARAINDAQVIVGTSNGLPVKWTLVSGNWRVDPLQSTSGQAEDITESGEIVGSSNGMVTVWHAMGTAESIGPGVGLAINDSRVVVATNYPAADGNGARAWTWLLATGWTPHTLPRLTGVTAGLNEPRDINDAGVIVGFADDASGTPRAVKWVPSSTTPGEWDPAVPLDNQAATTISAALGIVGQDIVGEVLRCDAAPCAHDPFHWSLTAGEGLGSLGSENAWAEGLNAQRAIVGSFYSKTGLRGFVWTPANPTIRDLGIVAGYRTARAYDINDPTTTRSASQAVGEATSPSGKHIAVLWTIP